MHNCMTAWLHDCIERLYEKEGLEPQNYIIYVGFPDMPLLKEKEQKGFYIRSGANTNSIYYWPAISFPDIHNDLPITYFNFLSFSLRYPKKLISLINLIRETGKKDPETLKKIPTNNIIITKDIVKEALRSQFENNNDIYEQISKTLYSKNKATSLTEAQKIVVNSYVHLFELSGMFNIMTDKFVSFSKEFNQKNKKDKSP